MKKTLAFLSALIMAAVSIPVSTTSAEDFVKGDVDMDGAVTGRDAAIVSQYADGVLKMELNEEQLELADMNGDGNVDAADAALIAEIQTRELWDVDGDGFGDISDSVLILRIAFNNRIREIDPDFRKDENFSKYYEWADVNLDGEINNDDCIVALQCYAKQAVQLPAFTEGRFYELKYVDVNDGQGECVWHDSEGNTIIMSDKEYYETFLDRMINKYIVEHFDADGDGIFSISDASTVLSIYANSMSGNGIYKASAEDDIADANGDGVVDISDATLILKIYAYDAAGLL